MRAQMQVAGRFDAYFSFMYPGQYMNFAAPAFAGAAQLTYDTGISSI